jgi:hypothetical protein
MPLSPLRQSPAREIRRQQGTMTTIKVKIVCQKCNNEWMSEIVDKAKPIVRSLLLGKSMVINPTQQRELATWIALCCITAEYLPGNDIVVPASHRRYLFRHHRPPEEFSIFIGHFSGRKHDQFYRQRAYYLRESLNSLPNSSVPVEFEDAGPFNTIESIFILAAILSYTFMTTSSPRNSVTFETWANPDILIRIWPPRRFWPFPAKRVIWPPETSIDDSTIEPLTDAFHKHMYQPKPL